MSAIPAAHGCAAALRLAVMYGVLLLSARVAALGDTWPTDACKSTIASHSCDLDDTNGRKWGRDKTWKVYHYYSSEFSSSFAYRQPLVVSMKPHMSYCGNGDAQWAFDSSQSNIYYGLLVWTTRYLGTDFRYTAIVKMNSGMGVRLYLTDSGAWLGQTNPLSGGVGFQIQTNAEDFYLHHRFETTSGVGAIEWFDGGDQGCGGTTNTGVSIAAQYKYCTEGYYQEGMNCIQCPAGQYNTAKYKTRSDWDYCRSCQSAMWAGDRGTAVVYNDYPDYGLMTATTRKGYYSTTSTTVNTYKCLRDVSWVFPGTPSRICDPPRAPFTVTPYQSEYEDTFTWQCAAGFHSASGHPTLAVRTCPIDQNPSGARWTGAAALVCECDSIPGAHTCSQSQTTETWAYSDTLSSNYVPLRLRYTMPASQWLSDPTDKQDRGPIIVAVKPVLIFRGTTYTLLPVYDAARLALGEIVFTDGTYKMILRATATRSTSPGGAIPLGTDLKLWYGSEDAIRAKGSVNDGFTGYFTVTAYTEDFSFDVAFVDNNGRGLMKVFNDIDAYHAQRAVLSVKFEWVYRKCPAGSYQVGDECVTCAARSCLRLKNQVRHVNAGTQPAIPMSPCEACTCHWDCQNCNPATCGCDVDPNFCFIDYRCIVANTPRKPEEPCVQCRPPMARSVWSALTEPSNCTDGDICTGPDACEDGFCTGPRLPCLTKALTGRDWQNCEVCAGDRCLPSPDYAGCVHVDSTDGSHACGCSIDGACYPHGTLHPNNTCLICDVLESATSWTSTPPKACDDGNACSYDDVCNEGVCAGFTYTCEGQGPCLASTYCDGLGGCANTFKPNSTICQPEDDPCKPASYCNGYQAFCPPVQEIVPIITTGTLQAVYADGSALDADRTVSGYPSITSFAVAALNYSVACGWLDYTLGFYSDPDGTLGCDDALVPFLGTSESQFGGFSLDPLLRINDLRQVSDGQAIRPVVIARNIRGGLVVQCLAEPVVMDSSPPLPGSIRNINPTLVTDDGSDSSQQTGDVLAFTWSGFREPSMRSSFGGALRYDFAVGTTRGGADVVPWRFVGVGARSATTNPWTDALPEGTPLYVSVRGWNRQALYTIATGASVMIDNSGPINGRVLDGLVTDATGNAVQQTYGGTAELGLSVQWYGFEDPETDVAYFEVAFGLVPGGTEALAFTRVPGGKTASSFQMEYPDRNPGIRYFASVKAVSHSGAATVVTSSGSVLDISAPSFFTLLLGGYHASRQAMELSWTYVEGESVVQSALVWAGKTTGAADVVAPTRITDATVVSGTSLVLSGVADGDTLHVCAELSNIVGYDTDAVCQQTIVDSTPPVAAAGTVYSVPALQRSGPALSAHGGVDLTTVWDPCVEDYSPLVRYDVQLTSNGRLVDGGGVQPSQGAPGSVVVVPWVTPTVPLQLFYDWNLAASFSPVVEGWTYYTEVRCVNSAGLSTTRVSSGVVVDNSAPEVQVFIGPADLPGRHWPYFSSATALTATWNVSDAQSGITSISWAIGLCTVETVTGVTDFAALSPSATWATATGLALADGRQYCVTVDVTNGAGLTTRARSAPSLLDITPPTMLVGAAVRDVLVYGGADVDYSPSGSVIRATWRSSFADPQSGMIYDWCAGTVPGACDFLERRTVAAATEATAEFEPGALADKLLYVTVFASNAAGITITLSSDGCLYDPTVPSAGVIRYGDRVTSSLTHFTAAAAPLTLTLQGFNASTAPLAGFWVSVGSAQGRSDYLVPTYVGSAVQVRLSQVQLVEGRSYFATITAVAATGLMTTVASYQPVIYDNSAPAAFTVAVRASGSGSSMAVWTNSSLLTLCVAGVQEPHSIVADASLLVGNAAMGSQHFSAPIPIAAWTGLAPPALATATSMCTNITKLWLRPGIKYVATVVLVNGAGLSRNASTPTFTIDETPPEPFQLILGSSKVAALYAVPSSAVSGTTVSLPVTFTGVVDQESGVSEYWLGVGSAPGLTDVVALSQVATATTAGTQATSAVSPAAVKVTYAVSNLRAGRYFLTARLFNGVGSSTPAPSTSGGPAFRTVASDFPFYYDLTAPTFPSLPRIRPAGTPDGDTAAHSARLPTGNALIVLWPAAVDAESEVLGYEVRLVKPPASGTAASAALTNWTSVGLDRHMAYKRLNMSHGTRVAAQVRATNHAGQTSAATESAVTIIDTQPPTAGSVVVLESSTISSFTQAIFINCQRGSVTVAFRNFSDVEPVASYSAAMGLSPGFADLVPVTAVTPKLATGFMYATLTGLRAEHGTPVYATVQAYDAAGNAAAARSVATICVSRAPNMTDVVVYNRLVGANSLYGDSASSLSVRWEFTSPARGTAFESSVSSNTVSPSGFARYLVAISNSSSDTDIFPWSQWVDVGLNRNYTWTGLQLTHQGTYYMLVAAESRLGLRSYVSAVPVTVDLTNPIPGQVTVPEYIVLAATLPVQWTAWTDPESPMRDSAVSAGTSPLATNLLPWITFGTRLSYNLDIRPITWTAGQTVYINVRGCTEAGRCSVTSSVGIKVDTSEPVTGPVLITATASDTTHASKLPIPAAGPIYARWSGFSDPESGIASYTVCVGTSSGGSQVVPCTNVGNVTRAALYPTGSVPQGSPLYVTVTAISRAKMSATRVSSATLVDRTPPTTPLVYDGYVSNSALWGDASADIDWIASPFKTFGCHWTAARDDETGNSSLVYAVAIGYSAGGTEVRTWTTVPAATRSYLHQVSDTPGDALRTVKHICSVRVTNGAGLSSIGASNGAGIDVTAPLSTYAKVADVTTAGIWATSNSSLSLRWAGFVDGESGIAYYEAALTAKYTTVGDPTFVGWRKVGATNAYTFENLSLQQGKLYFGLIRATNPAGLVSQARLSAGQMIDSQAPHVFEPALADAAFALAIQDAAVSRNDPRYSYLLSPSPTAEEIGAANGTTYYEADKPQIAFVTRTGCNMNMKACNFTVAAGGCDMRYCLETGCNPRSCLLKACGTTDEEADMYFVDMPTCLTEVAVNNYALTDTATGTGKVFTVDITQDGIVTYPPTRPPTVAEVLLPMAPRITVGLPFNSTVPLPAKDGCYLSTWPFETFAVVSVAGAELGLPPAPMPANYTLSTDLPGYGARAASVCEAGFYRSVLGACVPCAAGFYKPAAGDEECGRCPVNTATGLQASNIVITDRSQQAQLGMGWTGVTTCTCFDDTQVFVNDEVGCACKPGRIANPAVPRSESGTPRPTTTKPMCVRLSGNLYKAVPGDDASLARPCPAQTQPNRDSTSCMCAASSFTFDPETEQCVCGAGRWRQNNSLTYPEVTIVDDNSSAGPNSTGGTKMVTTNKTIELPPTCELCPLGTFKALPGPDRALCRECGFGTRPNAGRTACEADPSVVYAAILSNDTSFIGCPAGTVLSAKPGIAPIPGVLMAVTVTNVSDLIPTIQTDTAMCVAIPKGADALLVPGAEVQSEDTTAQRGVPYFNVTHTGAFPTAPTSTDTEIVTYTVLRRCTAGIINYQASCVSCPDNTYQPLFLPLRNAFDISDDSHVRWHKCSACPALIKGSYFISTSRTLYLTWAGIFDDVGGSGIVAFEYAIGSVVGGSQVVPFTPVPPTVTSLVLRDVDADPGIPLFLTVLARDAVGFTSVFKDTRPVFIDVTPPIASFAIDGTPDAYTPQVLAVTDAESVASLNADVTDVLAAFGDVPAGPLIPLLEGATEEELDAIIASTDAEMAVTLSQPMLGARMLVDEADPFNAAPRVWTTTHILRALRMKDALYEADIDYMRIEVAAIEESIKSLRRTLQIADAVDTTTSVTTVNGTNTTTEEVYNWRNDPTFVSLATVEDVEFQYARDTFSFSWEPFTDTASGIAAQAYCLGTRPYACDLVPAAFVRRPASMVDSVTLTDLDIPSGTTVFGTVMAVNNIGLVSMVTTNGVLVDDRPPYAGHVVDVGPYFEQPESLEGVPSSNQNIAVDLDCDVEGAGLGAAWEGFGATTGIAHYEWAVGSSPNNTDVLDWVSVGTATSVYNSTLRLPAGAIVYSRVRAIGRSGLTAEAASDGLRLVSPTSTVLNGTTVSTLAVNMVCVSHNLPVPPDQVLAAVDEETGNTTYAAVPNTGIGIRGLADL